VLALAGVPKPDDAAAAVVALETRMARVHATRAESLDVLKANKPVGAWRVLEACAGLDWGEFLGGAPASTARPVIVVWHPAATRGLSALVPGQPLASWKHWLTFHTLDRNAAVLPKAFVEARFAFHGKALSGTPQLADRWKRGIAATNAALPEAVGQLYVERFFPPETKAQMQAMVKNLIAAFGARIDRLEWMSPANPDQGEAEARHAAGRRGLSRHVDRLPRAADREGRRVRQPAAGRALRVPAPPRQAGRSGRQGRMVDVAADCQRRQPCRCRTR
jgi:predicted metalloendopeptidase